MTTRDNTGRLHLGRPAFFFALLALVAFSVGAQDNTATYQGASASVRFLVPGGQQIHSVAVQIDTNQTVTDPSFQISSSAMSPYTSWPLGLAIGVGVDTDSPPAGDSEWRIDLTEPSTGVYLLVIQWNPRSGNPNTYGVAVADETWRLDLTLPSDTTFDVTATETRNKTAIITPNPVDLYRPPVAVISSPSGDQTINSGESRPFAGAPVVDTVPSGGALDHEWLFPGGSITSAVVQNPGNVTFSNATSSPEVHTVTYTVSDGFGGSSSDSVNITVNPAPVDTDPIAGLSTTPAADQSGDPWIVEGASPLVVDFDASGSSDDGSIAAYHWNLGEGQPAIPTTTATTQATYLTGEHTATLAVEDNTGHMSSTITVLIRAFPNQVVSFPVHRGVPYNPNPPTVDGEVQNDLGWRGAHRITFGDGAEPADLAFQALRDRNSDYLYLSFEVRNDLGFDADDLVVLTFSPDDTTTTPGNDRRLMVFPFAAGHSAGPDQDIEEIRMWSQAAGWTVLTTPQQTALGLLTKVTSFSYGGNPAWNLELRIPTSAVTADWVDFDPTFRFYFDVIRVTGPSAVELVWPQGDPAIVGDVSTVVADALSEEFNPNWWGTGDASGTHVLKGVYISPSDIGTRNTPASKIELPHDDPGTATDVLTVTNVFDAVVSNTSEKETAVAPYSSPQDGYNVRVRFRIANWGMPGPSDWIDIPVDYGTGTPPESEVDDAMAASGLAYTTAQNVPAPSISGSPGQETFTVTWTLNLPADQTVVTDYLSHSHQCMLAIVDSLGGIDPVTLTPVATNIYTSSVYRNMNFGNASRFSQPAVVSTRGYGQPPTGFENQRFLVVVSSRSIDTTSETSRATLMTSSSSAARRDDAKSQHREETTVEWSAHGYLYTGNHIVVNGNSYEIARPSGSFGHYVSHSGEVAVWRYSLDGATRQPDGSYSLEVPAESSVTITPTIRPLSAWPLMVALSTGSASPFGSLAASYGTGWRISAELGYRFDDRFMVLITGGVFMLPPVSGGSTDYSGDVLAGFRYSLPKAGRFDPYLQAVGGAYFDNLGAARFEVAAGVGTTFALLDHLDLEARLSYHALPNPLAQIVTAELGLAVGF